MLQKIATNPPVYQHFAKIKNKNGKKFFCINKI